MPKTIWNVVNLPWSYEKSPKLRNLQISEVGFQTGAMGACCCAIVLWEPCGPKGWFLKGRGQHAWGGPGEINYDRLFLEVPTAPAKFKFLVVMPAILAKDYCAEITKQLLTTSKELKHLSYIGFHPRAVGGTDEGTDTLVMRNGDVMSCKSAEMVFDVRPRLTPISIDS